MKSEAPIEGARGEDAEGIEGRIFHTRIWEALASPGQLAHVRRVDIIIWYIASTFTHGCDAF